MKYEVRGKFLMGDLTFYVEADNDEAALHAATNSAFKDTMKLAKQITVLAVPPLQPEQTGET